MDWVLIFSILWVVNGEPSAPTIWTNVNYASKELCDQAIKDLQEAMTRPVGDGIETYAQAACVLRKDGTS